MKKRFLRFTSSVVSYLRSCYATSSYRLSHDESDIRLRKFKPEDIQEIYELTLKNFSYPIDKEVFKELNNCKDSTQYVLASNGGEILGTVGIRDSSRVCWLCVKYKGLGHGRYIMQELINIYGDSLTLGVKKDNTRAINLYLSLGFKIVGEHGKSHDMSLK